MLTKHCYYYHLFHQMTKIWSSLDWVICRRQNCCGLNDEISVREEKYCRKNRKSLLKYFLSLFHSGNIFKSRLHQGHKNSFFWKRVRVNIYVSNWLTLKYGPSSLLIFVIHSFFKSSFFGIWWKCNDASYLASEVQSGTQQWKLQHFLWGKVTLLSVEAIQAGQFVYILCQLSLVLGSVISGMHKFWEGPIKSLLLDNQIFTFPNSKNFQMMKTLQNKNPSKG